VRTCDDEFLMISAKEILGLFPECEVTLAPPPLSKGEALCEPAAAAVRQPGHLLASPRRSLGFAPPPHDGFAFLASARRCACRPTSLPIGEIFTTIFEVVGVFFRHVSCFANPESSSRIHRRWLGYWWGGSLPYEQLLLLSRVARWFPMAHPSPVTSIPQGARSSTLAI
jgi:hypothetical protein